MNDNALADSDNPAPPSRTALKRDATARQKLGEALTELSAEQLQSLELPERLLAALTEYQRLKARGAKRRQLQFIGALMRDLDPEPIAELLQELSGETAKARYLQHQVEQWRERLLGDATALTDYIDAHPEVDRQQLRQLVEKARRAQAPQGSEGERKRSARALFRFLRQAEPDPPT